MTCPSSIRVWCPPSESGLPGLTLAELSTELLPFLPTTFIGLTDTPSSFSGQGGKIVQVNAGATALEFAAAATSGKVKQVKSIALVNIFTSTSVIPVDDTIPQITEGAEVLTVNITPNDTTNLLLIDFVYFGSVSTNTTIIVAAFRSDTTDAVAVIGQVPTIATNRTTQTLQHVEVAGTTSEIAISVRQGSTSGAISANGKSAASGRDWGGVAGTRLRVIEVSP